MTNSSLMKQAQNQGYAVTGPGNNLRFSWGWLSTLGKGLWEVGKIVIPTTVQVGGQAYLTNQQYEQQLEFYLTQVEAGNQAAATQVKQTEEDYRGQKNLIIAGGAVIGLAIFLYFTMRKK